MLVSRYLSRLCRRRRDGTARLRRALTEVTLWTIGHGAGSFAAVERRLALADIQLVVDMRLRPSAAPPEWDRRRLEASTAEAGLGYRGMGAVLGHHPAEAEGDDVVTPVRPGIFDSAVDELVELSRISRTALLCAEESPDRCSRSGVIAAALRDRGIRVVHILGDASLRADQPHLPLQDPHDRSL